MDKLIERLRRERSHPFMRNGEVVERMAPVNPDGPEAATALERARTLCEMIVNASMGSSSRMRGESSIGWQKNDGADADSVRKCARETLALITGKSNG